MHNPFESITERLTNIESLLLDLKHQPPASTLEDQEEFLSVPEAAQFLKLTTGTIYKLTSSRAIPHIKKGKKCYFSRQKLEEWLKEGSLKTADQIQAEAELYMAKNKRRHS